MNASTGRGVCLMSKQTSKAQAAQDQGRIMRIVRPRWGMANVPGKSGRRRVELEPEVIAEMRINPDNPFGDITLEQASALIAADLARVVYD